MPGPHDFTFVSGFAFLPHCDCFGHMMLQLSPSTLVCHLSPLSPVHSGCYLSPTSLSALWPHDFTLVSDLSSSPLWVFGPCEPFSADVSSSCSGCNLDTLCQRLSAGCTCLHLSFCLSLCLDTLGRMILHLSLTCLPGGLSAFVSLLVTFVSTFLPACLLCCFTCLPACFTLG